MDDRDTCPVCFDIFTLPKLLPCQHTFCLQCLKDYCDQVARNSRNQKEIQSANSKENGDEENNSIVCPLCRDVCKIPKLGFQDLMTNYFVQRTQTPKHCQICDDADVVKCCKMCCKYVCNACFRLHDQKIKTSCDDNGDEAQESLDPRLPFHLLIMPGIRTEYICELNRSFKIDMPPDDRGMHPVLSVVTSQEGGAYVLTATTPFILRYDCTGKLLAKIRLPEACYDIIELQNGDLLGIFRRSNLILRFMFGGWSHFTTISDYVPCALVELSDGNILVSGLIELDQGPDKEKSTFGVFRVHSTDGILLDDVYKTSTKCQFVYPNLLASNKVEKTFAVADRNSITVFRENWEELGTYSGGFGFLKNFPLPLFQNESAVNFNPIEMCCSPEGNFIVSSGDGTLHILDYSGKLIGIALANCTDGFGHMTDIDIDSKANMWCSNSEHGTIKIFRLAKFKNRLNR